MILLPIGRAIGAGVSDRAEHVQNLDDRLFRKGAGLARMRQSWSFGSGAHPGR
jgi:hypothetical protein